MNGLGVSSSLEIKLKAVLTESISQFKQLTGETSKFNSVIATTITNLDKAGNVTGFKQTLKNLDDTVTQVKKFNSEGELVSSTLKKTTTEASKLTKLKDGISNLFDINKLYLFWNLTKRLRDGLKQIITSSMDYIETENKFNMSMGTAKPQATLFVNQMTEAIGIAKTELMNYQSTYKNILSGLGNFTSEQSEKISESLVKMSLDYSSLFNVGQDEAMNKFQSALVGSIRPIRSDSGYDVSDTTLGEKAKELGVERSIGKLNQMEKRLLRIIVLMEQLRTTGAMGDLARTIEQPANQLRVLQAQIKEVGVWLGNVFMGVIGKILPYINGFVMALKEVIKFFAIFVGYKSDSSDLSDVFETVEDSVGGTASGLDSANKKAKELRKTLMSFDVLNVINTPINSNSSSASGGGSIDPKILDALKEYDSLMEKVRMKATSIRDKIMEWLGFIKQINPLTGETEWILKSGITRLTMILDIVKSIGVALLSWKISKKILDLFNIKNSAKLATSLTIAITGFYVAYKGIKHMLNGDISIFSLLESFIGATAGTYGFLKLLFGDGKGKHAKPVTNASILKIAIPLAIDITLVSFMYSSVKENFESMRQELYGDIETDSLKMGQKIIVALNSIGMEATEILLSIGDFFGVLSDDQKKMLENCKEMESALETITEEYDKNVESIKKGANEKLVDMEYTRALYEDLKKITDENGNIQIGYEKRAEFILGEMNNALGTEYSMNNGIIQNYKDMQTEIDNVIEKKKAEIEQEAYLDMYKESLKEKIKLTMEYQNEIDNLKSAQQKYNEDLKNGNGISVATLALLKDQKVKLNDTQNALLECDKQCQYYSANYESATLRNNGNTEEAQRVMDDLEYTTSDDIQKMIDSATNYGDEYSDLKDDIKLDSDNMIKSYEDVKKETQQLENQTNTSTNAMKTAFGSLDSIKNVLDNPLSNLFSTLNPANPFGWGAKIIGAAFDLAKKISEKLNISANINANVGGTRQYGTGGFPDVGEYFLARESGPELVGRIGNRNTVMNNQQIVSAVAQGVAQAVAGVIGNTGNNVYKFYLDERELTARVEERKTRNSNIYGD